MRCWKCGAQVAGSNCLSCGCLQNSRRETVTEIGKSLRYAYDKFGAGQILTDRETLRRCLSDLLPDEKKLRGQIASVMQANIGQQLYNIMATTGELDRAAYGNLAYSIQEQCGLNAEQARAVLGYLIEMIGCEDPSRVKASPGPSIPQEPPAPEHREEQPRPRAAAPSPVIRFPVRNEVRVLLLQKGVALEDATHGVNGWGGGRAGDFYVRNDGIAYHMYHGFGGSKPSETPDIFLPRQGIVKVLEHFFIGTHAFTIVMADGTRYRGTMNARKDVVVKVIEAIRSLIS